MLLRPAGIYAVSAMIAALTTAPAAAREVPFATASAIASSAQRPILVDLDGDGDLDVLAHDLVLGGSAWYENLSGDGSSWSTARSIQADGSTPRAGVDLDRDGDTDVVASSGTSLVWIENLNGVGTSWSTATTLAGVTVNVNRLAVGDIDGDGDPDVVASRGLRVLWYENDNGDASSWTEQVPDVYTDTSSVSRVRLADLDGDGDLDVVSESPGSSRVSWHRNDNGDGSAWTNQTIDASASNIRDIAVGDVDSDGDVDVAAVFSAGDAVFYANDGVSWTSNSITSSGVSDEVDVVDVDGDGDLDVVGSDTAGDSLDWAENANGSGTSWTPRSLGSLTDAALMTGGDIDGDGDHDVAVVSDFDDSVSWFEAETIHRTAAPGERQLISSSANLASEVQAADIDGDGDLDVVGASASGLSWFENDGSPGGLGDWSEHVVTSTVTSELTIADLDGDGDLDLAVDRFNVDSLRWFENMDGAGMFGPEQVIVNSIHALEDLAAVDLDRDGDFDLLAGGPASSGGARLLWYENDGTPGGLGDWAESVIDSGFGVRHVQAGDLDGDGDPDVVATGQTVHWYANDGSANFGAAQEIANPLESVMRADIVDLDGDGDLDVLAALFLQASESGPFSITWYENDGTPGGVGDWIPHVLATDTPNPWSVQASDLDLDGDPDVLVASSGSDTVAWYENLAGDASSWAPWVITREAEDVRFAYAADLDGDGDPDVLSASQDDDSYAWHENRGGQFRLQMVDLAPRGLHQGDGDVFLAVIVDHVGRPGDGDLELVDLELRLESSGGTPLTSVQANALIDELQLYRDDELLVATIPTLSLVGGVQTLSFSDADPNFQIAHNAPRAYILNVILQADAASQSPDAFRIVHITEASSSAEDRDHDIPLYLEAIPNAATGLVEVGSPDSDGDGIADHNELALGTNPALADTDGDGLLDGEEFIDFGYDPVSTDDSLSDFDLDGLTDVDELTIHGTSPFAADTDGDGIADNIEIGSTEPLDSSVSFTPHAIGSESDTPNPAAPPVDIDGDGDLDFVLQLDSGTELVWYENAAGNALSWTRRPLFTETVAIGAGPDSISDVDGDGDPDVVALVDGGISWLENTGVYSSDWTEHPVVSAVDVLTASTLDVDGDGDEDIVATRTTAGEIVWYENDGSEGTWTPHTVFGAPGAGFIPVHEDMDRNGAPDIVTTLLSTGPVLLFENADGVGQAWVGRELAPVMAGVVVATTGDLDRDGSPDVAFTNPAADRIDWLANTSGDGSLVTRRSVTRAAGFGTVAASVPFVRDVDLDGDLDLMTSGAEESAWYENDSDGGSWLKRRIATASGPLTSQAPADLDGDGDVDLIVVDPVGGALTFYENRTVHRSAYFPEYAELPNPTALGFVRLVDMDRDGDLDVLARSGQGLSPPPDDPLRWLENTNGDASAFVEHVITSVRGTVSSARAADLDGDGDLDIASARASAGARFGWHENLDGLGTSWRDHPLNDTAEGEKTVFIADLDGDGDLDVIGGAETDTTIYAFENVNGDGSLWTESQIDESAFNNSVLAADIDGDGDLDVLSAGSATIRWHENQGDSPIVWNNQIMITGASSLREIVAIDIDGDGDLDIASTSTGLGTVQWHENVNGDASAWTSRAIPSECDNVAFLSVSDLDADGDVDIACPDDAPGPAPASLRWYENDGTGLAWTEHLLATSPSSLTPRGIGAGDLDGDGIVDIVATWIQGSGGISWYRNRGGQFALPTTRLAYLGMVDGRSRQVLQVDAAHRGRSSDQAIELQSLALRLDDEGGTPLDTGQANALVESLSVYRDDGDGVYDGGDTLVRSLATLSLSAGVQTIDVTPTTSLAPQTTSTHFVVIELTSTASSQTPNRFEISHLSESGGVAQDGFDKSLRAEFQPDTSSGVIEALPPTGDEDSDGLSNADEADIHDTDPGIDDTDGDMLIDGDEVNVHTTSPLDLDSDDDGLDDGNEVAWVFDPNDPDSDGDGYCDGPSDPGGGACPMGVSDNCPADANGAQTNSDSFSAGDVCQCGNVDGSGGIDASDLQRTREHVVGRTPGGAFLVSHCDLNDDASCDVQDLFLLERAVQGASVTLLDQCAGYKGP